MSEPSNIRKLLTDSSLGLLPLVDKYFKDIETSSFGEELEEFQLKPYDLNLGECNTLAAVNETRPLITQAVAISFPLVGLAKDKFELLLLASEFQNMLDATILEWSNREWYQFEKPLKRPVTQLVGRLDYELLKQSTCQITVYREFELIYVVTF